MRQRGRERAAPRFRHPAPFSLQRARLLRTPPNLPGVVWRVVWFYATPAPETAPGRKNEGPLERAVRGTLSRGGIMEVWTTITDAALAYR